MSRRSSAPPLVGIAAALAIAGVASCGYRPAVGAGAGASAGPPLHVVLARSAIPDVETSMAVVAGAREAIAEYGAVAPGDGYPRVAIEVLREDELAEGVAAVAGGPVARGSEARITARAWLEDAAGAPPEHDTGDVRAEGAFAVDASGDPRGSSLAWDDARRAVGRRVGRELGARILGEPVAASTP